jgi:hypothetical protein
MWVMVFVWSLATNAGSTFAVSNLPTEKACKELGTSIVEEINKDRWIRIYPDIICKQIPKQ